MYFQFNFLEFLGASSKLTVLFVTLIHHALGADLNDYTRLRNDLKTGYDANTRPTQYHTNVTTVQFSLLLRGFEFDERRSLFTLYSWALLYWNDFHMKWDPASYGNITEIHFAAHEVWQPDISVYNKNFITTDFISRDMGPITVYDSDIDHFQNTRVIGHSEGKLFWVPPTTFKVGCSANLRKWPYDTQTCYVVMGSWAHSGDKLDIRLPENYSRIDHYEWVENREWKLLWNTIERREVYYSNIPFMDILLTMQIQRRPSTHTAAVVVPALAIATAILISFWLRPGATERLALILFVTVINSMYLYNVYLMIPNNGDNVPLVILYYRDSLLMVSVALLWTIGLRYLAATKRSSPVPLPGFIQTFLDSMFSKILCLDPRPKANSSHQSDEEGGNTVAEDGKLVHHNNPYQEDWAWLAHLLDRVAFVVYLIIYIIFTMALL